MWSLNWAEKLRAGEERVIAFSTAPDVPSSPKVTVLSHAGTVIVAKTDATLVGSLVSYLLTAPANLPGQVVRLVFDYDIGMESFDGEVLVRLE